MVFRFVPCGDRLRPIVEAHVQRIYRQTYDATVRRFPHLMVADFDEAGAVRCAAGLRRAGDGFFSECYVTSPLEKLLSDMAGGRIVRTRIIEVNNLASSCIGSSARLIRQIIAYSRQVGTDWAVFTITPQLRRLLCQMKLPIIVLGAAEASRVINPADWGRYYDTGPVVAAMQDPGPEQLPLTRVSAGLAAAVPAALLPAPEPAYG